MLGNNRVYVERHDSAILYNELSMHGAMPCRLRGTEYHSGYGIG